VIIILETKKEILEAQSCLAVSEAELYDAMRCCEGSESNLFQKLPDLNLAAAFCNASLLGKLLSTFSFYLES